MNEEEDLVEMAENEEDEVIAPADRTCDLIGDGSQPYALPTLSTIKHDRFKRIDATTLVKLIDGDFSDSVESFTIVDCRYPYEYHGGHIIDSVNIHTGSELMNLLLEHKRQQEQRNQQQQIVSHHQHHSNFRHIIVFHCEFSSERGPRLMKLLREKDRQINQYPELTHPELYLLDGGYRDFYKNYKHYCVPQAYKPMKARNHREELRDYRKRRKQLTGSMPRRKENRTPDISFEGG